MDMRFYVDYAKNAIQKRQDYTPWHMLQDAIDEDKLSYDEHIELFKLAGMPDDAAEFLTEWYPELAMSAVDNVRYTYGFDRSLQHYTTEEELAYYLEFLKVSEEEYEEKYGFVIRDAAFDGIVVSGQ